MLVEWSSLVVVVYCPKVVFSITLGAGLLAYYLLEAVKRPVVACRAGRWRGFLEGKLNILQKRYWPTPWCYEAHCQTIIASILRSRLPDIPYKREVLELKDGGQVSLDWLEVDNQDPPHVNTSNEANKTTLEETKNLINTHERINGKRKAVGTVENGRVSSGVMENGCCGSGSTANGCVGGSKPGRERGRLVVVLPGLTGSSQSEYVKGLVLTLQQEGLSCVILNNRGIGGVRLMTTRTYCAANSDDLEEALDHLANTRPNTDIFIIGISLGGMITGNYLATRGPKAATRVVAAAVVSAPWNMVDGLKGMERPGLNLLLNRYLASCLCDLADSMSYQLAGKDHDWDLEHVMKSQTMRDFDTRFTSKQFGFSDAEDYYRASSLHTRLHRISVPLLCLSAADDPFQPLPVLPTGAAESSSHVAMVVTSRGGHIGFMDGVLPSLAYFSDRLLAQLVSAVFSNLGEMEEVRKEADRYREALVKEELLETSL